MSIAEDPFNLVVAAYQECYRAGVAAGDASGRSAQKLAALLVAAEAARDRLVSTCKAYPEDGWSLLVLAALQTAIYEAGEP